MTSNMILVIEKMPSIIVYMTWVLCVMIQADTCPYRWIQTHTYRYRHIQTDTYQAILNTDTYDIYTSYKQIHALLYVPICHFFEKNIFHQIQANTSKYMHILTYTSQYKLQYLLVLVSYFESVCVPPHPDGMGGAGALVVWA
jgi:hypothetical protein